MQDESTWYRTRLRLTTASLVSWRGSSALLLGTLADSHYADGLYLANGGSGGWCLEDV